MAAVGHEDGLEWRPAVRRELLRTCGGHNHWLLFFVALSTGSLLTSLPAASASARWHVSPHDAAPLRRPVAVFGKDERRQLPAEHRGLRNQIGLLYEPRSRSVCTAFCVAPDAIATAAHCLFRTQGERPLQLSAMWFQLGMKNPKSRARIAGAGRGAAPQHVLSGSMRLSVRPPIDATRDWAVVRLDRSVCTAGGLRLSEKSASDVARLIAAGRVYQVAFHRDFRNWELAHAPCSTVPSSGPASEPTLSRDFTQADNLLLHGCDTGGASSGSPLLVNGPSGPEVVAMNVGTYVQSRVMMQKESVVRRFKPTNVANTAVSVGPLSRGMAELLNAGIIDDRARLRELQQLLTRSGFSPGKPDGVYGPALKSAIELYEQSRRQTVTGLATEALFQQLSTMVPEHKPTGGSAN